MRALTTLINREFWEQRNLFFRLPSVIGGIIIIAAFFSLLLSFSGHITDSFFYVPKGHASAVAVSDLFFGTGVPFAIVLWITVLYYFLGTLYRDRKDGSILFWQSMPTTQKQTMASKLIAGLIIAPLCTITCMMVTQLVVLFLATLFFMMHPLIAWTSLWHPFQMIKLWLEVFLVFLQQGAWLLPILTWCLLCSAFAKKAPALRAILPIIGLILLDLFFFKPHYFIHFFFSRFAYASGAWKSLGIHFGQNSVMPLIYAATTNKQFALTSMIIGLILSVIFVVIAGSLRSRCYDFEK